MAVKVKVREVAQAPKEPQCVTIEKIKNGFTVRKGYGSSENVEFAKNLMQAGSIAKRLFKLGDKNGREIKDSLEEGEY